MPKPNPTRQPVRRVITAVCSTPWAIEESVLTAIVELLQLRQGGREFTEDEIRVRIGAASRQVDEEDDEGDGPYTVDGVAVLPLTGVLAPKLNFFQSISGGTSTQEFAGWFKAALANPDVKSILLAVDSPGGSAQGNEELAQLIRASRGQKPIVASVTNLCASAAYYIASAADEIIASPSSELGSIGTYMIHGEASRANENDGIKYTVIRAGENKAAGNSVEPLTDKPRAVLQERIDDFNAMFVAAVAANRGVSAATVEKDMGGGKVMIAEKAVAAGLADKIGTFEQVFDSLRNKTPAAPAATGSRSPLITLKEETMPPTPETKTPDNQKPAETNASPALSQAAILAALGITAEQFEALKPKPPAQKPPVSEKDVKEAAGRERARIEDLQARGKLLRIDAAHIQAAIDDETPVAEALLKWTEIKAGTEKGVNGDAGVRITHGAAHQDKLFMGSLDALSRRAPVLGTAMADVKMPAFAHDLQYKSLLQIAEEFLLSSGIRFSGDTDDLARAALAGNGSEIRVPRARGRIAAGSEGPDILAGDLGYQRPSDFPNLLSALVGKMMDLQLTYSPATYQNWAYQIQAVPDFKPKTIIALGEYAELPRVPDGADFTESSISEEASWIQADAYGDEWTLTPKMIQDDDLGGLEEVVRDKQLAHEMTLNRLCINLLTGNVTAGDGNNLFDSANHGNDRTSGGVPSTTELAAMRLLFRKMKGVSARRKLNLTLRGLLIPEDQETTTQQLLANLKVIPVPVTTATGEIFRGTVDYWVEPMLGEVSSVQYYGFAERNSARGIIFAFQRGFEGMKTRNYYWPKNNCRVFQFEGRFAAAVRNWRGVVRNAGQ